MSETLTEAARIREAVADVLDDARTTSFPDHPVLLNGAEVSWRAADIAFIAAKQSGGGPMFPRWLRALPSGLAYVQSEQAEFNRTGEPCPGPDATRDAVKLPGLLSPLVLSAAELHG